MAVANEHAEKAESRVLPLEPLFKLTLSLTRLKLELRKKREIVSGLPGE